jgi:hypothetical protein
LIRLAAAHRQAPVQPVQPPHRVDVRGHPPDVVSLGATVVNMQADTDLPRLPSSRLRCDSHRAITRVD